MPKATHRRGASAGPAPRQVAEVRRLGVGRKDGPDFLVEARDVPAAGAQLVQQPMPLQDGDAHAGLVGGQGHGLADELEALLQQFGPAELVA